LCDKNCRITVCAEVFYWRVMLSRW
jgi:hypothetical protein